MLATDGEMTFAIFLYNELQWIQADRSSSPAHVGFNDGILKFICLITAIAHALIKHVCCKVGITTVLISWLECVVNYAIDHATTLYRNSRAGAMLGDALLRRPQHQITRGQQ